MQDPEGGGEEAIHGGGGEVAAAAQETTPGLQISAPAKFMEVVEVMEVVKKHSIFGETPGGSENRSTVLSDHPIKRRVCY